MTEYQYMESVIGCLMDCVGWDGLLRDTCMFIAGDNGDNGRELLWLGQRSHPSVGTANRNTSDQPILNKALLVTLGCKADRRH
jgi:hypothetical protein